jgi:RimJ/RimL family protein N-acetyltransferase
VRTCPDAIRTERLILRRRREDDLVPFRHLNADPLVRKYFGKVLDDEASDTSARWLMAQFAQADVGPWAVEVPGEASFVGFVGLWPIPDTVPLRPGLEIAWRLAASAWGRGYATEAAVAAARDAFARLNPPEILAYAVAENRASTRVMEKLGMVRDEAADFDHPLAPAGNPLRRNVVYAITREAFAARHPEPA